MPPLVSVITPTFNHEKFIGECIDSVLSQTFTDWEQIIIDDGSEDRTAELVETYADPRIQLYRQKNAGIEALASTYNRALHLAQGDLIAILEGDDTWPNGKLSILVPAFEDPSVVLAYGEMREMGVDGRPAKNMSRTAEIRMQLSVKVLCNDPPGTAIAHMLTFDGHSMVPASTVLIRRSALESIGGFQYVPRQQYVDFPTFIRLAPKGKFFYSRQIVGYRRMHSASATRLHMTEMLKVAQQHRDEVMKELSITLTDADRRRIEKSWRNANCGSEFALGRLRLFHGEWKRARAHFARAISIFRVRVSIGAACGWALSWLHRDLEWLFHLGGRATLRAHSQ